MRQPGDVFDYPFLWAVDAERGLDNPKDRRTTLALLAKRDDEESTHLLLLGITDAPRPDQVWLDVPPIERRRAGLSVDRPAYVVVSEYDYDVLPGSHDYNPQSKTYGRFSAAFVAEIRFALTQQIKLKRAIAVTRPTASGPPRRSV
jgi:hypothetical protein